MVRLAPRGGTCNTPSLKGARGRDEEGRVRLRCTVLHSCDAGACGAMAQSMLWGVRGSAVLRSCRLLPGCLRGRQGWGAARRALWRAFILIGATRRNKEHAPKRSRRFQMTMLLLKCLGRAGALQVSAAL